MTPRTTCSVRQPDRPAGAAALVFSDVASVGGPCVYAAVSPTAVAGGTVGACPRYGHGTPAKERA